MNILKIIAILLITASISYAQTIVIGTGANLDIGSGVDVCSGSWGNITGNLTGLGSQCDSPMPVNLISFTASVNKTSVLLRWNTISELNNAGFEIQCSPKNVLKKWNIVGYVNGSGTKTTPTNYSFEDKKLKTGKYEYRLKQLDYNGNYEYHNLNGVVEIGVPSTFELSQNYPNPFNPTTKIDFQIPNNSKVTLKIYDLTGKEIATLLNNEFKSADYYTVTFNGVNLASGMYFYRIATDKFTSIKKMMLIK